MPPLGAYGQGGGTGALSLHDERWPEAYRGALLTGDWGRSEVYRHDLKPAGASFRARSERLPHHPPADGHGHRRGRPALRGELARGRGERLRRPAGRLPRVRRAPRLEPDLTRRSEAARAGRADRRLVRPQCGLALPLPARDPAPRSVAGDDPSPHRSRVRRVQAPARARRGPLRAQAARRHRVARRPAQARGRRGRPRVRAAGAGRPQDGAGRRRGRAVPRGAGRSLAPRPGAGRDRARATGRRRGGPGDHPADLAPRGLADADERGR